MRFYEARSLMMRSAILGLSSSWETRKVPLKSSSERIRELLHCCENEMWMLTAAFESCAPLSMFLVRMHVAERKTDGRCTCYMRSAWRLDCTHTSIRNQDRNKSPHNNARNHSHKGS